MISWTDGILVFYTFVTQAIGGHTAWHTLGSENPIEMKGKTVDLWPVIAQVNLCINPMRILLQHTFW